MISRQIVATLAFFSGPGLACLETVDHLRLALGPEDRRSLGALDFAHFVGERGPPVQQTQELAVDLVDFDAQVTQAPAHQPPPSGPAVSAASPSEGLASFSTIRCRPLSFDPSSSPISVTPCVARPSSRISLTRVRTSTPLSVISMISSSACTSVAATTLPLRSLCWIAIMPLVPRPCRVYSEMDVRLP